MTYTVTDVDNKYIQIMYITPNVTWTKNFKLTSEIRIKLQTIAKICNHFDYSSIIAHNHINLIFPYNEIENWDYFPKKYYEC